MRFNNLRNVVLYVILTMGLSGVVSAQGQYSRTMQRGGRFDAAIEQSLQQKLAGKDRFNNVRFFVDDGVVTLNGTVNLYYDFEDAGRKAKGIDHVQSVQNLIRVNGAAISDERLEDTLAKKLRYDRAGFGSMFNSLGLRVTNGIVEIRGTVFDYPSRSSALAIVRSTPGVRGIRDQIEVAPNSGFDDRLRNQLARAIYGHQILARYASDPQAPIRIVVKNGHVELFGVVDNNSDRIIAGMQARQVPGVFSVDNHLTVEGREMARNRR